MSKTPTNQTHNRTPFALGQSACLTSRTVNFDRKSLSRPRCLKPPETGTPGVGGRRCAWHHPGAGPRAEGVAALPQPWDWHTRKVRPALVALSINFMPRLHELTPKKKSLKVIIKFPPTGPDDAISQG